MKKIILVGHSHTNCLYAELLDSFKDSYLTKRVHILEVVRKMNSLNDDEKGMLGDHVVAQIDETILALPKNKHFFSQKKNINIILLLGGSFHHMLGLMKSDPPFDFIHPKYPTLDLDDDAQVIPYYAVKEILLNDINEQEKLLKSISSSFTCNIFHLGFPPTVLNEDLMMSKIEPFFLEKYEQPKLAHFNLRFKLWRLYSDLFSQACSKYDIPFLQVPDNMLESGMFLKEEAFGDSMHANQVYAKHYIKNFSSKLI